MKIGNWPIYFRERLQIGNLASCVGIATLWTPVGRILADVPCKNYAVAGQLYTKRGVDFIVRNILANPQIRYLIVCGVERTGSGEALLNFQITDKTLESSIELVRKNVRVIDLRGD